VKPLRCYIWGSVDWEQYWDRESKVTLQFPTPFTALNDMNLSIKQVAAGAKHTLIVANDGKVWGFGNNAKGQLGLELPWTFTPVPIAAGKGHFVQASCGTWHSLLLTQEGKVWSFGSNVFGQLGHTPKTKLDSKSPTRVGGEIEFLKIVQIAAGGETSYALSDEGHVYAWGSVQYGALGTGTNGQRLEKAGKMIFDDEEKPVKIQWFVEHKIRVKKIAAGTRHLLVLSDDKKLYTCGHGAYGRLGQGNDAHDKVSPVPITWYTRKEIDIQDIFCGSEHSLCTALMGQHLFVYFWGRPGNDNDGVMTPTSVDSLCGQGISGISAGKGITMVCTDAGEAAIWGENSLCSGLGIMGTQQKNKRVEPKVLELMSDKHVQEVHSGFWHMMAFVDPARSTGEDMLKVPQQGREFKAGGLQFAAKARWEDVVELFQARCKEPPGAAKHPSPAEPPAAKKAKTTAAKGSVAKNPKGPLKVGTKLKAWFEDVWVPGTVQSKSRGKNKYMVAWDREGWKPEEVELNPDDHTVDASNPDRWQLV